MISESIAARIQREVGSWPQVSVEVHSHGMIFFHVGRREIGHLHGDRLADLPFPVRIREELVSEGKASLHYLHPKTGLDHLLHEKRTGRRTRRRAVPAELPTSLAAEGTL